MGLFQFFLGPSEGKLVSGVPVEFRSTGVAGQAMGTIIHQRGTVSEDQVEQFKEISKNAEENAKRIKVAVELIKKIDAAETEVSKEVFSTLNSLEKNAFKRAQYQENRRRENRIMQEKFASLRSKL